MVRTNKIRNHEIFLKVVVYAISITLVYMTMKPLWDLFMQFLGQGVIRQNEIVNIKLSKILPQRWKEFVRLHIFATKSIRSGRILLLQNRTH